MKSSKRYFALFLVTLMIITALPLSVLNVSAETDGIFEYDVIDENAVITGITDKTYSGALDIPDTIGGYTVTAIGDNAFAECENITSAVIPDTVTKIGWQAFAWCYGLKTVTPGTSLKTISDSAFTNCTSLESFSIPDTVTTMGMLAFGGCTNLTSVTLGKSLKSIPESAFSDTGLTSITVPASVKSISEFAFYGCVSLKSVSIPDSVTALGSEAFDDTAWYEGKANGPVYAGKVFYKYKGTCPESVSLKSDTIAIAVGAFNGCKNLISITIPASLKSIGENAFLYCAALEKITVKSGNKTYKSTGNCLIKTGAKTLVLGCKKSKIPSDGSVTSIGKSAFYGSTGLKSITIPDSVKTIGDSAFYDCNTLAKVNLGKSVKSIDGHAFEKCKRLANVYYAGTSAQRKGIYIGADEESESRILGATWHYRYSVSYKLAGGKNNSANPKYFYDDTASITLKKATRKGYAFKGWFSDKKLTKKVSVIKKGTKGNKTLYAKWSKVTYKISYKLNKGKNGNNPKTYTVTTSTVKLKNPTRKGYTFKGWYSDSKFKKKVTKIAKGSTGNKTLYAKWARRK